MANLKKIFDTIKYLISMSENKLWLLSATPATTLNVFKAALFVKHAIEKIELNKETSKLFQEKLNNILRNDLNITDPKYTLTPIVYFSQFSDIILKMFLMQPGISTDKIKVAIRVYISVCGIEAFKKLIKGTILYTNSYKIVVEYLTSASNIDSNELKAKILIENWIEDIRLGKSNLVRNKIESMIGSENVEIQLLLTILILDFDDSDRKNIAIYIKNKIIDMLTPISVENKNLWLAILKEANISTFAMALEKHDEMIDILLSFSLYIHDSTSQQLSGINSVYPEINEDVISHVLFQLCKCSRLVKRKMKDSIQKENSENDGFVMNILNKVDLF